MQKGFQVELVASAPYHSPHRPGSGEPSPQPSKRTVAILDDLAEDRQYDLQSLPELLDLCMSSRSAPPGLMLRGRNGCGCVTCAFLSSGLWNPGEHERKYCLLATNTAGRRRTQRPDSNGAPIDASEPCEYYNHNHDPDVPR